STAMMAFIIMAVVNVGLDLLLVLVLKMGIIGVSIATTASVAAATGMGVVVFFTVSKNFTYVKVGIKEMLSMTKEIIMVGSPGAVENVCILLRSFTLNKILMTGFGALSLSAFCVIGSVNSFALAIIAGVSGTIVPFVGIFSAEMDTASIKQVLRTACKQGVIMTSLFAAVCVLFSGQIGSIFGMSDPVSQALVKPAILLFAYSLVPAQINSILISLHISNQQTRLANVLTLLRQFLAVAVVAVILSGPFGVVGVWHSFWIAEVITLVVCAISHLFISRKNKNLSKWTLLDETAEKSGSYISFSVANSVEDVMKSVEKISEFCDQNTLSPKRSMLVSLSLEEMLNCIRTHCLGDNTELNMSVRILIYQDILVIRIRNAGNLFNPIEYYKQMKQESENNVDAMLALEDGLGIKIIIDACDVVDYRTTFGVNNLTVII
ncbi:MAG: ATP-binding protein, partial [Oscillospiraceae bacterium]